MRKQQPNILCKVSSSVSRKFVLRATKKNHFKVGSGANIQKRFVNCPTVSVQNDCSLIKNERKWISSRVLRTEEGWELGLYLDCRSD